MTQNIEDIYPLTPVQQGLLLHTLKSEDSAAYVESQTLELVGLLDVARFSASWQRVIDRHAALRSAIVWEGVDQPLQVVRRRVAVPWTLEDWRGRSDIDREAGLQSLAERVRQEPFELVHAPLLRLVLVRLEEELHALIWCRHHIVLDGWSSGLVVKQVLEEYGKLVSGEEPEATRHRPFSDYVAWLRLQDLGPAEKAWREELQGFDERTELRVRCFSARADVVEEERLLSSGATAGLERFASARRVTLNTVVLSAWAMLLGRYSGRSDVVFGVTVNGRPAHLSGVENMVGVFINTLPARVRVDGDAYLSDWLREVQANQIRMRQYEHAPLTAIGKWSGVHGGSPLFESIVVLDSQSMLPDWSSSRTSLRLRNVVDHRSATDYPVVVVASMAGRGSDARLTVKLMCNAGRFNRELTQQLVNHLVELLSRIAAAAEDARVRDTRTISSDDRRRLSEWNATSVEYPRERCVQELFEEQARRTPDAIAVVYADEQISYGELNERANRLAHRLRALGVRPDERVVLCVEPSVEAVVSVLGVLKSGGAYVAVDPTTPAERFAYIVEETQARAIVTQEGVVEKPERLLVPVVKVDADWTEIETYAGTDLDVKEIGVGSRNVAYVTFTSGSTGKPKGVMVEHHSVVNVWQAVERAVYRGQEHCRRVSLNTSLAFDASVDQLSQLLSGRTLVVVPRELRMDAEGFAGYVERHRIEGLDCTPTHMEALSMMDLVKGREGPSVMLVGGELMTPTQWDQLSRTGKGIYNAYGPSECTVDAAIGRVSGPDEQHIGRPIANTRIYLLDEEGRPVPVGVAGELCIGGAGVARGYLNRAELTAERFVADPYAEEAGARMYRTGDLARYRPDGNIEFLGRTDFQVKVRGYRIELGEIEAQLNGYPGVREAVVVAREESEGDKRLVAYYREEGEEGLTAEELRGHLLEVLPEYMVPAAYVKVAEWPLTVNGKLDRKGLPGPEEGAYATREYEAPRGETERELARIWSEVLGVERIGRHDNFFELGGHSLLAVSVIERMRRSGLRVDVRTLFTAPTLATLSAEIGRGAEAQVTVPENRIPEGCEAITPQMLPLVQLTEQEIERIVAGVPGGAANVRDIYPLAPLQEGILFHHLLGQEGDPYLMQALLGFDSRERLDRFIEALQGVVDRHDILRTAVQWEGLREPVQVVWRKAPLAVEEVRIEAREGDVSERLRERFDPRRYRLDVRTAPLMKLFIAHDGPNDRWLLLWTWHHLSGDHTTLEVIQREVRAFLQRRQGELPRPLPFRNFVAQARLGISNEEHEEFFRNLLGDVAEPTAPFGLTDVRGEGTKLLEARHEVAASLSKRLRKCGRALGVSAASLCHLAFAQVLARLSGRDDVVFGTVLFGRMQGGEGADWVPGLFMNTLPVRIAVGEIGVEQSVRDVHGLLAQLLRHEHASLALAQRCSAVAAPMPVFSALLNYRHNQVGAERTTNDTTRGGIVVIRAEEVTTYPLTVCVDNSDGNFAITSQIQAPFDPEQICGYMRTALEGLVEALERAPSAAVASVEVLPEEERARLLVEWNATAAEYPRERCVHELIEEQARKRPDAIAVVYEEGKLSYGELNSRANRLARYLREQGVGADRRVGICMERSLEMVVSLLGVLKAGGAYVPLDPGYPWERLEYMLKDSEPSVVLTHGAVSREVRGRLEEARGRLTRVVDVEEGEREWEKQGEENLETGEIGLSAQNLAYVIYTSGSTGRPKAVAIEHRALVNRLWWMQAAYELAAYDAVLQKTPLTFDVSVWEFWWPLLTGARLVVARPQGHQDPSYLATIIRDERITTLHFVPSMLAEFVEDDAAPNCTGLRRIICSGEALAGSLVDRCNRRLDQARLYNLYGPTEATIDVTACATGGDEQRVPIGRPIANTRIYLLDEEGRPVPVGVAGELCIGGAGVARGYLNRAELTAERFVADPYAEEAGARMYRTGDLARYRPDGNIEFLGRTDFQVKVRGYRIELGEIEAQLNGYPGVREAVVVAREESEGDKRLVAYYREEGEEGLTAEELRGHLLEVLPEYMVPAAYVKVAEWPLTVNGKLDRKGLPGPEEGAYATREYEAPRGETERELARIWSEVLGVERIGRHDNFFELGGHSLLATKLLTRIRAYMDVEITLETIFLEPALDSLAKLVIDAQLARRPLIRSAS